MENSEQFRQRQLAEIKQGMSSTTKALVVDQDWDNGVVTVSIGGSEQRMGWIGSAPWPGDMVRVISAGGAVFCAAVYGPALGTVVSSAGGYSTVTGDDSGEYVYPHVGAAPADASRVRLDHAGRGVLAGEYPVEPDDSEFTRPAPPPSASGGEAWFNPAWSGNWNPGFQGSAAEISSTRTALYGYGTQIRDTIDDSSIITVAQLHLTQNWDNVPGVASSMGTHGHSGPPGSASNADLSGSYAVPGGSVVVDLLGVVASALQTGSALGVGFRSGSSGWRQYAAAPGSGRIFMRWS